MHRLKNRAWLRIARRVNASKHIGIKIGIAIETRIRELDCHSKNPVSDSDPDADSDADYWTTVFY